MRFLFLMVIVFGLFLPFKILAQAKPRILVLYSYGGHKTAAQAIEALVLNSGIDAQIQLQDFAEFLTGFPQHFHKSGYSAILKNAPWLNSLGVLSTWREAEKREITVGQRVHANFNQPARFLDPIRDFKPDIIITTHFTAAEAIATLREQGFLRDTPVAWTHLDYVDNSFFLGIASQIDVSFVPTSKIAESWQQIIGEKRVVTSGVPLNTTLLKSIGEREVHEVLLNHGISRDLPLVLLMGGTMGALPYPEIIRELSKVYGSTTKLQIVAVTGKNETMKARIEQLVEGDHFDDRISVTTLGYINQKEALALQSAASVFITKPGGLTTTESLFIPGGLVLTEAIGPQEIHNAKYMSESGAALYIKSSPKDVAIAAVDLLGRPSSIERQRNIRQQLSSDLNSEVILDWIKEVATHGLRPEQSTPEHTIPILHLLRERKSKKGTLNRIGQFCRSILSLGAQ